MTFYKDRKIAHCFVAVCTSLWLFSSQASAQLHAPNIPANKHLKSAEELFAQEQYKAAVQSVTLFNQQTRSATSPTTHSEKNKAAYIYAMSALKLNEADAETTALTFINQTANPAYKQRAAYTLAQSYFKNNRYADAIKYYELTGVAVSTGGSDGVGVGRGLRFTSGVYDWIISIVAPLITVSLAALFCALAEKQVKNPSIDIARNLPFIIYPIV